MKRFESRTVLVTGGTNGIGLATAKALAREGALVVVTGRTAPALTDATREIDAAAIGAGTTGARPAGPGALGIEDATGNRDSAQTLKKVLALHGITLDGVFVNAGITRIAPLLEVDERAWDESFDANVKGAFFQLQALVPLLNPGAAIVLNGSINAHIGVAGTSVYSASKAALISLARTLSAELLPRAVRVNVVSPGPVDTRLNERLAPSSSAARLAADELRQQVPLGRLGTAEEIAATVLHLLAPESAFVVGAEFVLDGGMSQL